DHRRQRKDQPVGLVRNEVFLGNQLDEIRERLQQPEWSNAHRSEPRLNEGADLPFNVHEISDDSRYDEEEQRNLNKRPDQIVDYSAIEKTQPEQGGRKPLRSGKREHLEHILCRTTEAAHARERRA